MEPITWLVIGLSAGWLAGLVMKGNRYGLVGDIAVGIVGGLLFVLMVPGDQRSGLFGTIVVAAIGAALFVGLARVLTWRTMRA
jgi:uncharacterized membrane protein YeaQ/YmgE (transglycosylase-associated protein family)